MHSRQYWRLFRRSRYTGDFFFRASARRPRRIATQLLVSASHGYGRPTLCRYGVRSRHSTINLPATHKQVTVPSQRLFFFTQRRPSFGRMAPRAIRSFALNRTLAIGTLSATSGKMRVFAPRGTERLVHDTNGCIRYADMVLVP